VHSAWRFFPKNRTSDRFVTSDAHVLQVVWPVNRVCKMCDLSAHGRQVMWSPVSFTRLVDVDSTQKVSKFGALGQEFASMRDGLPDQCPRLRICYIPYLAVRSDGKLQQQVEKVEYIFPLKKTCIHPREGNQLISGIKTSQGRLICYVHGYLPSTCRNMQVVPESLFPWIYRFHPSFLASSSPSRDGEYQRLPGFTVPCTARPRCCPLCASASARSFL
jgi:hypothetical protein